MAEWSVPLDVLAKRYGQRFEDVVRMATVELFSRVVLRSPVDTGRFRANWFIGYGEPDVTTTKAADLDGSMKTHQIRTALATSVVGSTVYLTNSLPYAAALEYGLFPDPPMRGSKKTGETEYTVHVAGGYSMQAPQGMVRITVAEFAAAVNKAIGDAR